MNLKAEQLKEIVLNIHQEYLFVVVFFSLRFETMETNNMLKTVEMFQVMFVVTPSHY